MSNSIAPGSSADVNVKVTALTTNPNVPAQYKTIILKKNLVNGVNTLTQEMMAIQNIKYVIKYNYVLGEDITIPANCILEFDGGSISAGNGQNMDTITSTNTSITAGLVKIFDTDITLAGTWNVVESYPEWFGAKGDGVTDDTFFIQKTFDTFNIIKLSRKEYKVETVTDGIVLNLPSGKHLIGVDIDHKAENKIYTLHCENNTARAILQINNSCIIENITIKGISSGSTFSDTNDIIQNGVCCIKTNGECGRITLNEIQCLGGNVGFFIMAYLTNIEHCYSFYNLIGFAITGKLGSDGTLKVENTTINMKTCYCILSHRHAFYIKGLVYSNFENLAADGCGHELVAINSWNNVYAPYYFESLRACNFLSIGAEKSLKMIKTSNCINIAIRNLNFNYGFHVDEQKNGSYTPGHLFEFTYSNLRLEDPWIIIGGCDPSIINTMLNDNPSAPLIYLEDKKRKNILYRFYGIQNSGVLSKNNIFIGGFITSDNIVVEDNTMYKDSYDITSGSIVQALDSIDFKNNPYHIITINFSKANPELGIYTNKKYNFYGKTVIFKNTNLTSPNVITCDGQVGSFIIENGTFILKDFSISDNSKKNREKIFVANNTTIKFININFLEFNVESINYIVNADANSYVEAINCIFTRNFKKLSSSNNYKCYFDRLPVFKNEYAFEGSIIANTYIAHGNGIPNLELINKVVNSLPTIFSSDYIPEITMKGMQVYYNNKLYICDGTQWRDAIGTPV